MKLSVFTTITDPERRGDHYEASLKNYCRFADEVIVIDGSEKPHTFNDPKIKVVHSIWEKEFEWKKISEQFQLGYDNCTGDWVMHMDLDFLFHENNEKQLRELIDNFQEYPALTFWKYQFILPDRYAIKSRLVLAVNKKVFNDRIKFDGGGESDLCQPSFDGTYINPRFAIEARLPFYNYEKMTKTKEQVAEDSGRMDRAYHKQFGEYQLSKDGTDESAFEGYMKMVRNRIKKAGHTFNLEQHPQDIRQTILELTPDQMGYSLFGTHRRDWG